MTFVITMPSAAPGEAIPGLGVNPEIDQSLATMKVNEASPLVTLPNNRLAVAVLNNRIPGRPSEFNEVQAQIRDKMINDRAAQVAGDRAKELAEKVKKGEDIASSPRRCSWT